VKLQSFLGVLSVRDCISDNVLEVSLENSTGLFLDKATDTLDTTTTSEPADSGLGVLETLLFHWKLSPIATITW
jgi:hypothetical protein